MTTYKNIELSYNYEEWRLNRLKSVIDFLDQPFDLNEISILNKIKKLEDDKGILKVYYNDPIIITILQRLWIKHIWTEENEHIVKFIREKNVKSNEMSKDDELKYIDFNTNI